jgi:hypothetical protein
LDADPDEEPDPAPRLHNIGTSWKIRFFFYSQHCLIFLVSVIGVTIFNILNNKFKFSRHKYCLALHLVEMDTNPGPEPNQQAFDADPAK